MVLQRCNNIMNWLQELTEGDIVYLRIENRTDVYLYPARLISKQILFGKIIIKELGEFKFSSDGSIFIEDGLENTFTGDRVVVAIAGTKYDDPVLIIPNLECLEVHNDWIFDLRGKVKAIYGTVQDFADTNRIDYLYTFWFFKGIPIEVTTFKRICRLLAVDWEEVQKKLFSKFQIGDSAIVPSGEPIYKWSKFRINGRIFKNDIWFYWETVGGVQLPEDELIGISQWRLNLQDFAGRQSSLWVLALLAAKYDCSINRAKMQEMREVVLNNDRAIAAGFLAFKKNEASEGVSDGE